MTYKTLIAVSLVLSSFIISFDASAKDLPPLADGQMSYDEAVRLAKVYVDVIRRLDEEKPVSEDEITDAIYFGGWARGFAEGIVMTERGKETQTITECVEKYGYSFIPSQIASMFLTSSERAAKPSLDAQSHSYAALVVGCMLRQQR